MAKMDVLQEVKTRIKDLKENKRVQLEKIGEMQREARDKIENAEIAMKQATEIMDVDAYEEAKQAKHKAQTALDMYNGRFGQIKQQEYISETESDAVIDSLLKYEEQIDTVFKQDLSEQLSHLNSLYTKYDNAIQDIEETLNIWQRDIHANYQSRGLTTWTDPETGESTTRSPKPIPVHHMPYRGCKEAESLWTYLKKATPVS